MPPFAVFNFLGGGTESSFSVLLCLVLLDEAGFVGMLRLWVCKVVSQDFCGPWPMPMTR